MKNYHLLDTGNGQKLEQYGPYLIARPCQVALWQPKLDSSIWEKADGYFERKTAGKWQWKMKKPRSWIIELQGIKLKLSPTPFGHLGIFPEHAMHWNWLKKQLRKKMRILNLFAYTGSASILAAKEGAEVCHLDASKGSVDWAKENASLNNVSLRTIVDDVNKFLKREIKRGSQYDGVILDPPTFGRGSKGQVFKIERDLHLLFHLISQVMSKKTAFFLMTNHTPGFTPQVLRNLLDGFFQKGKLETGEMLIETKDSFPLPTGTYARWRCD